LYELRGVLGTLHLAGGLATGNRVLRAVAWLKPGRTRLKRYVLEVDPEEKIPLPYICPEAGRPHLPSLHPFD
jgi:hypothetical protein